MTASLENEGLRVERGAASGAARRALWLKTLHQWHWISSALALLSLLLFSVTGITLNHASQIEGKAVVTSRKSVLPAPLQDSLHKQLATHEKNAPLPQAVRAWLADTLSIATGTQAAEWSEDEVYLSLPRPGGDAWVRIGMDDGAVEYELTERGWIAWLNDLHKGRNTGDAWRWFIDIFAIACLVFAVTGLLILKFHAVNRPMTWPMVGLGVLVPLLLAMLFIH